jgi:DNA-binding transcriptional ArsR family regulator
VPVPVPVPVLALSLEGNRAFATGTRETCTGTGTGTWYWAILKRLLDYSFVMRILKYMLQRSTLDQVFDALSDPTRRAIVERLVRGPASVSELAAPFPMSLSAVGQHLQQLEASGLVQSSKIGRVRTVRLIPETLSTAELWFEQHRTRWEQRFDRLGDLLAEEISQKTKPKSKRKK